MAFLMPQQAISIFEWRGLRMSIQGLMPDAMIQYAAAARSGGARLEFLIEGAIIMPDTLQQVAAAGGGNVLFDLVSEVSGT